MLGASGPSTSQLLLSMRTAVAMALGLAITACTGSASPGPIGTPVDVRRFLPDSLRSETAPGSVYHQRITVGPDSVPVELSWTTFQHGPGRYLATVSGRLPAAAPYDSITLGAISDLQNVGSKFEEIESSRIQVRWFKSAFMRHSSGAAGFTFDALGRGRVDHPQPEPAR
jgi:hypothetical protein